MNVYIDLDLKLNFWRGARGRAGLFCTRAQLVLQLAFIPLRIDDIFKKFKNRKKKKSADRLINNETECPG